MATHQLMSPMLRARFEALGMKPGDQVHARTAPGIGPRSGFRRTRAEHTTVNARLVGTNHRWAGCVFTSGTWSSITATWKVSAVENGIDDPPGADGNYWMYSWVGLDGWGENELLQTGIAQCVKADGTTTISGWYEWVPDGPQFISSDDWPVAEHDLVCAMVEYVKGPEGTNVSGTITLANLTSSKYYTKNLDAPTGVTMPGQTAEWVVEDPGGGYDSTYSLALFTPLTFTSASCESSDGSTDVPGDATIENITNAAGTQMTDVGSQAGADNFWVAYYKYNIDPDS